MKRPRAGRRDDWRWSPTLSYEPRLLELVDLRPSPAPPPMSRGDRVRRRARTFWHRHGSVIGIIICPVLIAAIYLFGFAQDRYQAEARFIVRSPDIASSASLGSLLAGTSADRATEDAYAINSYLESQDALAALEKQVDIAAVFAKAGNDLLWHYPRWFRPDNREERFRQFRRLVSVVYDKTAGITSLIVQAYTPEDAVAVATALLENAERMANRMSVRAREDAARQAEQDLKEARQRAVAALDKLTAYRNREQVVDPTRITNAVVETISRLSLEIAQTRAQLDELQRVANQSPQIQSLRIRIQALERQVANERAQLAGTDTAFAAKIAEFELLALDKDFAEKLLTAAVNSAEAARLDVVRQRLYVERVVNPSRPDYPEGPRRVLLLGAVFFACFLLHSAYQRVRRAQFIRQRLG